MKNPIPIFSVRFAIFSMSKGFPWRHSDPDLLVVGYSWYNMVFLTISQVSLAYFVSLIHEQTLRMNEKGCVSPILTVTCPVFQIICWGLLNMLCRIL